MHLYVGLEDSSPSRELFLHLTPWDCRLPTPFFVLLWNWDTKTPLELWSPEPPGEDVITHLCPQALLLKPSIEQNRQGLPKLHRLSAGRSFLSLPVVASALGPAPVITLFTLLAMPSSSSFFF